jgi:hypothetical protein
VGLAIVTVANSIAALVVSGVTLFDVDEIPKGGIIDPSIIPLPDYLTNFSTERQSYGGGSVAQMDVNYTLNYRLLYKKAGAGVGTTIEYFDEMLTKAVLFLDAILAIDTLTGVIDIVPSANAVTNMGLVNSPDDLIYHGCDLHVDCTEFVN